MHVSSITSALPLDPNPNWHWNWLLHFVFTAVVLLLGFLHLLRSTTSKYFVVDTNFHSSSSSSSSSIRMASPSSSSNDSCAVCSNPTSKQCSRCKAVKYCSQTCQSEHWKSEHKRKCKELQLLGTAKPLQHVGGGKRSFSVSLVPSSGPNKIKKLVEQVLFPYDEFVKLFNWDKPIFPPCGLLNCGNSCFANVVLQCLAHTRPLLAYLLDKGHRRDCRRNEWCFLCELQTHMERASRGQQPFSPINILSRLPSIGGNLGYGKQEDAHEFMRFAIDTMQSVCLDEHGGEEVIHPKSQETTLIQHIFGGQLQSQVICAHCSQVSNQYENMMDLTVEIQGDATSLEDCLDQFTRKEWLHGDNMYKCDGCNDYVSAWKRLTIHQAPNILTIALKRFQSGRFGKINKKITFPESLDLSPYVSEGRDGSDKYKLYAVIVHVDMLNASFFGHYICYTKGFQGNWYRIDDCKVMSVEVDEVLSQGAYMLLYSRVSARPTSLQAPESASKQQQEEDKMASGVQVADNCPVLLANPSKSNFSEGSSATACQSSEQQSKRVSIDGVEESLTVNSVSSLPVSVKVLDNGDDSLSALTEEIHCGPRVVLSYPTSSREQSSSIVPDSSEPSSLCVNAASDTTYDASSSASVSLEETNGQITVNGYPDPKGNCVEPRTDGEPYVAGSADNNAGDVRDRKVVPLIDENAPCEVSCNGNGNGSVDLNHQINGNRNDPKMCHVSFSKEECEVLPDHMGLDPVELRQSVDISESAIDGMVMRDAPPEKSCVQGKRSCISNSSSELD